MTSASDALRASARGGSRARLTACAGVPYPFDSYQPEE